MKIGLIGNYGATNVGDEAILNAILKSHSDHEFVVFSVNPKETAHQFGVKSAPLFPLGFRSLFKHGFRQSFRALKSVDAVILGGGGLMQDEYLYACFLWAWQVFWVKFLGKPLFIYATGVGPLKTWIGRRLTRNVYRYAMGITVRDETSYNTLHRLGLPKENIEITADPAFLFKHLDQELARAAHTYLISLRPWLKYNSKIINTFTEYLLRLKGERNAKFIFVCMQSIREHDHRVIDPIMKKVGGTLLAPRHFSELLQAMSQTEFAIGMRYHFLIAAMLTKTPALAVSYSHKVDSLYKHSILEPYHLNVADLNPDHLEKKMKRLSVDYNNIRLYQKRRLEDFKELAEKNADYFDGFIKMLTENGETAKVNQPK
ncbi:polysaccharide pyruvyl transferase family protein [Patescibacteria group bacterium]|nr:polysaccharide pyruvyl transferase family protein [Patescibacteria group bacterium]